MIIYSLGISFILSIIFQKIMDKLKLPRLLGYLFAGIVLGSFGFNKLSNDFLSISSTLREIALVIIIFRAGLSLDIKQLMKNKISVILLSFIPATFEIIAYSLLGPLLLGLSLIDSLILGCIISAVSPAVIVPNMLKIIEKGYGHDKGIPEMIMSAASVDDIYVITIFLALLDVKSGDCASFLIIIPILQTIIAGIVGGIFVGLVINKLFEYIKLEKIYMVLLIVSILFIVKELEGMYSNVFLFSSLLSIMSIGVVLSDEIKEQLYLPFQTAWSVFEILLFVLIGAMLNIDLAISNAAVSLLIISLALLVRMIGVKLSLLKSGLSLKEQVFVMFSFTPKATVQAAIAAIPLTLGYKSGEVILSVSIVAILFTAPLGSVLINASYKKLLTKTPQ